MLLMRYSITRFFFFLSSTTTATRTTNEHNRSKSSERITHPLSPSPSLDRARTHALNPKQQTMSRPPQPPPAASTAASEEAAAAALDAYLLSPKFHGRVRAATVALLALTLGACATADWESFYGGGRRTVFSGVRPALRSAMNRLYGVEGEEEGGKKKEEEEAKSASSLGRRR
jgi:hypothetical protein